jgi:hypothetical protein
MTRVSSARSTPFPRSGTSWGPGSSTPRFREVNPARSSARFRGQIHAALDVLRRAARSGDAIAGATYDAIVSGRVRIDALADLRRDDYLRVRRDLMKGGVTLPGYDEGLGAPNTPGHGRALRAITSGVAGYMWDDRVYVDTRLSAFELAATLVHEVNHIFNQSEEHYRSPRAILVEEYRAFYAEHLFRHGKPPTKAQVRALKQQVIAMYGLEGVHPEDVANRPTGVLVPRR